MLPLLTAVDVQRFLGEAATAPTKMLGQNFVVDPNTIRKIVSLASISPGTHVVEIGPGCGALTRGLLNAGAEVTALEIDQKCVQELATLEHPGLTVIHTDALKVKWADIVRGRPSVVVANLPYNVATTLIISILEQAPEVSKLVVMVQREVGERLSASPGGRVYGIPSVLVSYWAESKVLCPVSRTVFVPRPHVDSVVVEVTRRRTVAGDHYEQLVALVRAGFGQRRKSIRNSLARHVTSEQFRECGIDQGLRAEVLTNSQWEALAGVVW